MKEAERDIIAHPARVTTRAVLDQATLLSRVRSIIPDPKILEELPPFFWSAEVSSDRLDTYYTRMSERTLRNYQEDAEAGVSFQNSHRTGELGFGRSIASQFIGSQGNGVSRLEVTFYTLSGLRLNDISTDDLIRGIRGGIVKDVSVGFYGGRYICSICGRDMLRDWDCNHVPGMNYDRVDPATGRSQDDQMCFAWVDNARLAEVSAVYEGSTPGAAIQKAIREAELGRITPIARDFIEQQFRYVLPEKRKIGTGIPVLGTRTPEMPEAPTDKPTLDEITPEGETIVETPEQDVQEPVVAPAVDDAATDPTPEPETPTDVENETLTDVESVVLGQEQEEPMAKPETQGPATEVNERALGELSTIRTLVQNEHAEAGVRGVVERLAALTTELETLRPHAARVAELERENARLAPLADMGTQYRAALIEETIEEGTRADGATFPAETYKVLLENASIDHIRALRDGFRLRGDEALSGGRRTIEAGETDTPNPEPAAPNVPAERPVRGREAPPEAYRTGR